jgi:hypothetical protein
MARTEDRKRFLHILEILSLPDFSWDSGPSLESPPLMLKTWDPRRINVIREEVANRRNPKYS